MVRYYVDLGLSVKWATCNLGAELPHECGDHYTWGKTTPTRRENEGYAETHDDISGNVNNDAARAIWGNPWRIPTADEMDELIHNCNWTWTTKWGQKGYKVKSKKNGNSIFLPAADCFSEYGAVTGIYGYYWTSTPAPLTHIQTQLACALSFRPPQRESFLFYTFHHELDNHHRASGYSIRPVID